MGCHGNNEFSHSQNMLIFRTTFFPFQGVPLNNLAGLNNAPGMHDRSNYQPPDPLPKVYSFYVIFPFFNEYANEMIFICDHLMNGLVKLYHL